MKSGQQKQLHQTARNRYWWATPCHQGAKRHAALLQQVHSICASSPFTSVSCSIKLSHCPKLKSLYLVCVISQLKQLNEILIDGPQLLVTGMHTYTYKHAETTNISIRMSTALHTASMELPASATKSFVGPGWIFKRENKVLCWLLIQKIITSALRQPFCTIQQVGRMVPDAGTALRQIQVHHMLLVHCQLVRRGVQ